MFVILEIFFLSVYAANRALPRACMIPLPLSFLINPGYVFLSEKIDIRDGLVVSVVIIARITKRARTHARR